MIGRIIAVVLCIASFFAGSPQDYLILVLALLVFISVKIDEIQ